MSSFYHVLGVRPDARDEEIKAAFRRLAKELHPDIHSGDPRVEQRLRDVISAYETVGDPQQRTAYDAAIVSLRSRRRRRYLIQAATTATTFTLTVCGVLAVTYWQELGGALLPARDDQAELSSHETRAVTSGKGVATTTRVGSRQEVESGGTETNNSADTQGGATFAFRPPHDRPNELVQRSPPREFSRWCPSTDRQDPPNELDVHKLTAKSHTAILPSPRDRARLLGRSSGARAAARSRSSSEAGTSCVLLGDHGFLSCRSSTSTSLSRRACTVATRRRGISCVVLPIGEHAIMSCRCSRMTSTSCPYGETCRRDGYLGDTQ